MKKITKLVLFDQKYLYPVIFTLLYIFGFSVHYIYIGDLEFIWYIFLLMVFWVTLIYTIEHSKLSLVSVWGLCFWGLLHMAGGGLYIDGDILYAYKIFPFLDLGGEFYILKFDQVVHFYGFLVATLAIYEIFKTRLAGSRGFLIFVVILVGMGLGVINEIAEFMAVLTIKETGVGGYYNTLLDLIFNTLGAIIMGTYIYFRIDRHGIVSADGAEEKAKI